ncbi:MAG: phosphotransferase, partial [Gammaproteobacteria bacterium]|nr:phosphotransferase [Gammaproteobacteria bacterium]
MSQELGYHDYLLEPASSDASFRRYFRVVLPDATLIVMDAPPDRQKMGPYLEVERRLRTAGLNVPEVLAGDQTQGFLLLTDLGKRQYLDIITEDNREQLYHEAMEALARMQEKASPSGLPDYNRELLRFELSIFSDWF